MLKFLAANGKSVYIIDWFVLFHNEMKHLMPSRAAQYPGIAILNISLINNHVRFSFMCPQCSLMGWSACISGSF